MLKFNFKHLFLYIVHFYCIHLHMCQHFKNQIKFLKVPTLRKKVLSQSLRYYKNDKSLGTTQFILKKLHVIKCCNLCFLN